MLMELTQEQTNELLRVKQWKPYAIIFGWINKDTQEFIASFVTSMRIPNKLVREGHTVFILK
jgi:hypothetical protein